MRNSSGCKVEETHPKVEQKDRIGPDCVSEDTETHGHVLVTQRTHTHTHARDIRVAAEEDLGWK